MTRRTSIKPLLVAIPAMAAVVTASNFLVQYPLQAHLGALDLADLLTWGAFTYPLAFLVTDLTNRNFGPAMARKVVYAGFVLAVALSFILATPRIAMASGTAFIIAQLLDVLIFNRLRRLVWWMPPLTSSVIGSLVDTTVFFSMAFAATFAILGSNDPFAIEASGLFGVLSLQAPRWVSWALGDLSVKLLMALVLLAPYGLLLRLLATLLPGQWEKTPAA